MRKGIEVNFFDLCRHLLKKWPVLLAFTLGVGILTNLYGWYRVSAKAEREQELLDEYAAQIGEYAETVPEELTPELAELRAVLTEQEASFVEAVAKLYMYRMWASDKINAELIVGEPDEGDLEIVQTLYYANEGVQSGTNVMTSAEKSYYNVLVRGLSGTDMSAVSKDISDPGFLQLKWLLVGCILGLFFGCIVVCFFYLASGKLRTASDMEMPYGIPVLANLRGEENTTELQGLTKGIERILGNGKTLAVCCADAPEAKNLCGKLTEMLKECGIETRLTSESGFVGEIAEADAVLFVEQLGKSRYSDIERHVSACSKFGVPSAGCVVVE